MIQSWFKAFSYTVFILAPYLYGNNTLDTKFIKNHLRELNKTDLNKGLNYIERETQHLSEYNLPDQLQLYIELSKQYSILGQLQKSQDMIEKALEVDIPEDHSEHQLVNALRNRLMGDLQSMKWEFNKALPFYDKAEHYYRQISDSANIAYILRIKGNNIVLSTTKDRQK